MSKELEMVRAMINGANEYEKKTGDKNPPVYFSRNNLLIIENALQRLESIDNSNPSEAMECLERLSKEIQQYDSWIKYINTIKQALLKAQEPKQYLKWEDLEFKEDNEAKIKVRMGEHIYDLWYGSYKTGYGIFKQKCSLAGYEFDEDYDIDFFDDLRLERVEE